MVQITKHYQCPVFTLRMGQKMTKEETRKYLSEISKMIAEGESFGLLFDYPEGQPSKDRGVIKLENEWFKGYRKDFEEKCFGVAMVTTSIFMMTIWKNVAQYLAKKTYGCDVNIFDNRSDAQMWLMDKYFVKNPK